MSLAIRTDEHNLISGSVDRIYCKIESGALPFAARSLVVLREGYVTIADLRIPQSSGTFTAKLGVSIIALSGELDLRKQQATGASLKTVLSSISDRKPRLTPVNLT